MSRSMVHVLGFEQRQRELSMAPSMISAGASGVACAEPEARFDARVLQHALDHLAETARFGFEQLPVALDAIAAADDAVRRGSRRPSG